MFKKIRSLKNSLWIRFFQDTIKPRFLDFHSFLATSTKAKTNFIKKKILKKEKFLNYQKIKSLMRGKYVWIYICEGFFAFLEVLVGLLKILFIGDKVSFHLGQFLLQIGHLLEDLVRPHIRLFRLSFTGICFILCIILLKLHRLHLLLDRVHGGGCSLSTSLTKIKSPLKT